MPPFFNLARGQRSGEVFYQKEILKLHARSTLRARDLAVFGVCCRDAGVADSGGTGATAHGQQSRSGLASLGYSVAFICSISLSLSCAGGGKD